MPPPSDDITPQLVAIVARHLSVDAAQVVPGARFIQDLGADSLDTVELTMAIEEAFDIEISDDDAARLVRVSDAVELIRSRRADARPEV